MIILSHTEIGVLAERGGGRVKDNPKMWLEKLINKVKKKRHVRFRVSERCISVSFGGK